MGEGKRRLTSPQLAWTTSRPHGILLVMRSPGIDAG
jgi:hypothetical protein